METIADLLQQNAFFTGLKPDYLALVAACGRNVHFAPGTYLLR
jgi:hypothetical protein